MKRLVTTIGLVVILAATGCSDEVKRVPGEPVPSTFADVTVTDTGQTPVPTADAGPTNTPAPDAVRELSFAQPFGDDNVACTDVDHCTIFVSFKELRKLEVNYKENGEPVGNQLVTYEVVNDDAGIGRVTAYSAWTTADGIATVEGGPKDSVSSIGQFAVKAFIADAPSVAPLYFDFVVSPKGQVPLTVNVTYGGQWPQVIDYELSLWKQTNDVPDCSDLDALYNGDTPASLTWPVTTISKTAKFPSFPGLEADGSQSYAVLAYSRTDGSPPHVLAWGCEMVEVTWGGSKTLTIDLMDQPPVYAGPYSVVSRFDFLSGLPDNVATVVGYIINFFKSPVGTLLDLACDLGEGTLDDVCDLIYSDNGEPTAIGAIAIDIIEAIIDGYAQGTIWGDILQGGSDIADILTAFEVHSTMTFLEEPDANGEWTAEQTRETLDKIVVKWSLGENCDPLVDENCGKTNVPLSAVQTDTLESNFTARVSEFWDLTIDEHPLTLNYGALVNYVIEKQLLPRLVGEGVDTYEKFFYSLLAGNECLDPTLSGGKTCCATFAEEVVGQGASATTDVIESACEALVSAGSEYIRDQLGSLETSTDDSFTLRTAEPCKLYDQDTDFVVESMGGPMALCNWKASLEIFGASTEIDATFWGVRAN